MTSRTDHPAGGKAGGSPSRRRILLTALCTLGLAGISAGAVAVIASPQSVSALAGSRSEAASNTRVIASVSALNAALKSARGGETFLLAPGDYSRIAIANMTFASPVTIASQHDNRRAKVMGLTVRLSSGLVFRNLDFVASPDKTGTHSLFTSRNIRFENLFVHGSLDNNPANDAAPFLLRDSQDVVVANSRFQELYYGIGFLGGSNLRFTGNTFFRMRMDGIRGGGASHVRVDHNLCAGFQPIDKDHPDCVQFWTTNTTKRVEDIVVENNISMRGDGRMTQGIFIRDTENLPFRNVIVRNNLLIGNMWHGIYVDGAEGAEVSGNEVVPLTDHRSWILIRNSKDIKLSDNASPEIVLQRNKGVVERGTRKTRAVADGGRSALQKRLSADAPDGTVARAIARLQRAND